MPHQDSDPPEDSLRQRALSRWDNEGGAGPCGSHEAPTAEDSTAVPTMGDPELVLLHIRVIALENLVIALLAGASDRQIELAQEMAPLISPRPGSTPHPLTTRASDHMLDLVQRASHFRHGEPS